MLLLPWGVARAQLGFGGSPAADAPALPDPASVEEQRAETAQRIAVLRAQRPLPEEDARELALLERLDELLVHQGGELARSRELREGIDATRAELARPVAERIAESPPYPLASLDAQLDDLLTQQTRLAELNSTLDDLEAALDSADQRHAEDERQRRSAKEALASAQGELERSRLGRLLQLRELESRVSAADLALSRLSLHNAREARELQALRAQDASGRVAWVRGRVEARPSDLERALDAIDQREIALRRRLEAAELDLEAAQAHFERARGRLAKGPDTDASREAELAARRVELTTAQRRVALAKQQLQRLDVERVAWRRRHQVLSADPPSREERVAWYQESSEWLEEAERERRLQQARIAELEQQRNEVREEARRLGDASRSWSERRLAQLRELGALYEADVEALSETRNLQERLHTELAPEAERFDLGEWLRRGFDGVRAVWRYEVVASGDNPVTVGKVVSALLFFLLGYTLARGVSHNLGRRVFPRIRVESGVAAAYQALVFYGLLVVAFLVALRLVNIPLTVFAIAGGALAIGIGFGSQNLMNNFISGIILLAERPIKLGDLVDVDGIYGTVERIGLRSTRIQSGENIHVIVPNSAFLENRVVNWTHNNPEVRVKVNVGVVYGSPTEKVVELLQQALAEHPQVRKSPEPIVLFAEFGDNSLNFEVHFWIRMRSMMDRRRVESDLRFRIDRLFRDHGLVIAFPQRDVHLDSAAPIEVRLVPGSSERKP